MELPAVSVADNEASACCCCCGLSLQRKVQLLSPDKQTFEVEWDVAMRSTVVKQMLEGEGSIMPWDHFIAAIQGSWLGCWHFVRSRSCAPPHAPTFGHFL